MSYLFTYGTLMKGQRASGLMEGCKYVGDGVLQGYGLYEAGEYPAAVPVEGFNVYGEVYEIDDGMLKDFDAYEDEGDLYIRKLLEIEMDQGKMDAWVYEYNRSVEGMELRAPEGKWSTERKPASNKNTAGV